VPQVQTFIREKQLFCSKTQLKNAILILPLQRNSAESIFRTQAIGKEQKRTFQGPWGHKEKKIYSLLASIEVKVVL
jgi:hypothetical protein